MHTSLVLIEENIPTKYDHIISLRSGEYFVEVNGYEVEKARLLKGEGLQHSVLDVLAS